MTEAAAANPGLTVGELVDKTTDKLKFMKFMEGYMEGAARMVQFEGALSSRAGAEHRRVLEHAEELLHKAEEYLEQRDAEAGAAASGARPPGARCLTRMRASWRASTPSWAPTRLPWPRTEMIPWRGPPRKRSRRKRCPMTRGELTGPRRPRWPSRHGDARRPRRAGADMQAPRARLAPERACYPAQGSTARRRSGVTRRPGLWSLHTPLLGRPAAGVEFTAGAAALAWCAVPSPSACRRGPLGVRHSSGSRPLGATTSAV